MCSKEVTNNSLFICIKGMEQDGHQYIQEAAERGAAACLVEEAFWKKSASVHGNLKQAEKKTSEYGELKLPERNFPVKFLQGLSFLEISRYNKERAGFLPEIHENT